QITNESVNKRTNVICTDAEKSKRIKLNIHNHLTKVTKLRKKGLTELEIISKQTEFLTEKGTGIISGVVFEQDGYTTIKDFCTIEVFNEYGKYMGSDFTYDYKNGEYSVTDLPSGYYYVRTYSDLYADEYYNNVTDWQSATLVNVNNDQETSNINFNLNKYLGSITGTVKNNKGAPIQYCTIMAENEMGEYVRSSETSYNGEYILYGLQSGLYKIQAGSMWNEGNYANEYYDNTYNYQDADFVTVEEPYETKNIDFVLEEGGTIKGKVFEPNGAAVYTYEVSISAYNIEKDHVKSAETDENGIFLINGLTPGEYKLEINYYGMKNYVEGNYELENWYDNTQDFNKAKKIIVSIADTVAIIEIKLHEGGKISGNVFDYNLVPLNYECTVTAYMENINESLIGVQVENGNYQIDKLPTGKYKIYAEYQGNTLHVGDEPCSEWYDGKFDFENASFVEVTAPYTTSNVNFTLQKGGYVSGKIYGSDNQLLSYSGEVYAYNLKNENVARSQILNDGMFFITGLPTGNYKLYVFYNGEEEYMNEWYPNSSSFETAEIISLTAPNAVYNKDFHLNNPSAIKGFVIDKNGARLTDENYLIQLSYFDAASGEFAGYGYTSFNGGYNIKLMEGNYKLSAVSYYANWMRKMNNDSLTCTFYQNGKSFNDPLSQTIDVGNNTEQTLSDFILEKVSGSISGTIYYDSSNIPISENYIVCVFDQDGYLSTISSYNRRYGPLNGNYLLCGLQPGNYYLLAILVNGFDLVSFVWYGGYMDEISNPQFVPKLDIPYEAVAVKVGIDEVRNINFYVPLVTDIDTKNKDLRITHFELMQNYPNPFNPMTTIKYSIPENVKSEMSNVKLVIYDILGREIVTLVNQKQLPGNYEINWNAFEYPSGVYFYQLICGDYVESKKMVLLK
ncbi:MAG: carboxypeptidase regulatory-like domain-containing protein, partial [Ignavibacteriae bacterium]|nr:carboxypeptidase regulatory-like domain-containing protein [Ignavibacteriota bacterium]